MSDVSKDRARHAFWVANKLEQKPEFKIIHTLIQPDADPNAVADKIVEYTILEVDNPQSWHFHDTAASVIEVARRTEDQDKLGEFVLALQQRWTQDDFQALKWTFADDLNQISGLSKKTREDAKKDENLNVFVAKLTVRLAWDFAWHGHSMLNYAFYPENPQPPPGCAIHTTRLACAWLVYAAPFIWAKVQDPGTKDENEGEVWSLELWNIWKVGLLTTQAATRNYETRKMIELAMAQMQQAEQGGNQ